MDAHSLSTPQQVQAKLEAIDGDLAIRQNDLEEAALQWFRAKRDIEHDYAIAYLAAEGTVDERKSQARRTIQGRLRDEEGRWEGLKAVIKVLETRANIGMALLKSHGRS